MVNIAQLKAFLILQGFVPKDSFAKSILLNPNLKWQMQILFSVHAQQVIIAQVERSRFLALKELFLVSLIHS